MDFNTVGRTLFIKNQFFRYHYLGIILLFQLICLATLQSQNTDRLIIFQGPEEILLSQSNHLILDFSSVFSIQDIVVLRAAEYLPDSKEADSKYIYDYSASLEALQTLIESKPGSTPLIAFVFAPEKGPNVYDVIEMLDQCPVPVKFLVNGFFNTHLSLIIGRSPLLGGVTFMQYGIGMVSPGDKGEESNFPTVPVIVGTLAGVTGIILITDNDTQDCTPVDASWSLPGTLCSDASPINLQILGTTGGIWSGIAVDALGNFNPEQGTQTITYTVGEQECERSSTQEITVLQRGDASWTTPEIVCDGSSALLSANGTLNGQWSGESIIDHGDGTSTFEPTGPGSYPISYTAGEGICMEVNMQTIEVLPIPDASWTIPDELCTNQSVELIPIGSLGGNWSGDGVMDNGDGTASFTQTSAGDYKVTYTVGTDCIAELAQNISVIEQADASWTVPDPVCEGENISLVPDGTIGGAWTGDGVTDNGDGTATFIQNIAGNYAVTYTVGPTACMENETHDILVTALPDASWTIPDPLCVNEEILLVPQGTPDGMWTGNGIIDNGDGTASFFQANAGTFTVTYTVGDVCIEMLAQEILVIDQADATWNPPEGNCSGATITLIATGTEGGTWSGVGVTSEGIFTPDVAGEYLISYQVGDGPCKDSLTNTIIVLLQGDASWTPPANVCTGQDIQLSPDGTPGGIWSGQNVTSDGQFTSSVSGDFEITYIVGESPCQDSITSTITVVEQSDPAWSLPDSPCVGETILLIPNGDMGGVWSGDGITDLGDGTAEFSQSNNGIYAVTYSVGEGVCASDLTQNIEVVPFPDATWFLQNDIICSGEIVNLIADTGIWSGENVIDFGNGTGEFSSNVDGEYTITLTVGEGFCTASESHVIIVGDNEPPVITVPAFDLIVECDGFGNINEFNNWIDQNGGASAIDNCGGIVEWTAIFDDPLPACSETPVTFTACDENNNCITAEASFIILDSTAPVFNDIPPDLSVTCENIPPPDAIEAFDICDGPLTASVEESQTTGCPYDITRIYSATDACGNIAEIQQTISVTDNIAPVGEPLPDLEVICTFPCDPIVCLPEPDPNPFTDNCDTEIEVTFEDNPIDIQPNFQIWERIYTGIDDCGNSSNNIQLIFIQCIVMQSPSGILPTVELSNASPLNVFDPDIIIPELNSDPEHPKMSNQFQQIHLFDFDQLKYIDISSSFKRSNYLSYKATCTYGVRSVFGIFSDHDSQSSIQARSSLLNLYGSVVYAPKNQNSIQMEAGILSVQQIIDKVIVLHKGKSNPLNTIIKQDNIQIALKGRYRLFSNEFGNLETEAILLPFNKSRNFYLRLKYVMPLSFVQTDSYVKKII